MKNEKRREPFSSLRIGRRRAMSAAPSFVFDDAEPLEWPDIDVLQVMEPDSLFALLRRMGYGKEALSASSPERMLKLAIIGVKNLS